MNTKQVGNLTELKCISFLYELGCSISIPFGNSDKYDFIMDYQNKLYKIQCKYAHEIIDNEKVVAIQFKTIWQSHNSNGYTINKYNPDEVDYFATYYNGNCYLVPSTQCSNAKILRIEPPKNNQLNGINFLKDYEAFKILSSL